MPEFLPCPFCGGGEVKMTRRVRDERAGYCATVKVECRTCGASVRAHDKMDRNGWTIAKPGETEAWAETLWNTRLSRKEA